MAEFSIKIERESIFKFLSFFNFLSWNGLVWKKNWCSFKNLSNHLLFRTNLMILAQNIAKWENGKKDCSSIFQWKNKSGEKEVFYLNTCKIRTTWPILMKFWYKKCPWYVSSQSKSLTLSGISGWWPGIIVHKVLFCYIYFNKAGYTAI